MSVEKRMCPHCGSQMFVATITRGCVVEVNDFTNATDAERGQAKYNVLKEGKDKFEIEIVACARCKEEVKEEDLVIGVQCKECGRVVSPSDIDENGVCTVCHAVHERAELANASREDLIMMLLNAEKQVNPVAARMDKKIEQAEQAPAPVAEEPVPPVQEEIPVEQTETVEEPKKQRRKPKNAKKKDDEPKAEETTVAQEETVDTPTEETNAEETAVAVDNIANQQEAPFPEMNLPEEEPSVPQEQPVVANPVAENGEQPVGAAGFTMFDEGEEPF